MNSFHGVTWPEAFALGVVAVCATWVLVTLLRKL